MSSYPKHTMKQLGFRKPLFFVVEDTTEMTHLFAWPDSAYESRLVEPDDTELKTPTITEY